MTLCAAASRAALASLRRLVVAAPSSSAAGVTPARSFAAAANTQVTKRKDDDMLETIDIEDLPRAQKRFAKQFEKVNEERIKEMFVKNYKNQIAFAALAIGVVSIYFYTMYAVKQETFLEEIDAEMAAEKPTTHGHLKKQPEAK